MRHPVKIAAAIRGVQLKDVADAVGVTPQTFYGVINGHCAPWPAFRRRCAEYFPCDEADLFPTDSTDRPEPVTDPAVLARIATLAGGSDAA